MWIDLRGIQEGTHSLVLEDPDGALELDAEAELLLRGFRFEGELTFDGRDYRVRGSLAGNLEAACDRCLARFVAPLEAPVACRAVPQESGMPDGADVEDSVIVLGDDRRLDLGEALRQAALPEVPIKNVCRPDCRGICPTCGVNRNLEPCSCSGTTSDTRWDALRRLSFPDSKE
jgi:uncharacterized protein